MPRQTLQPLAAEAIVSLAEYREAAAQRRVNHIDARIRNDTPEHAKILAEFMIGAAGADEEVYVYSGKLPEAIYGDWLKKTKAQAIHILVDDSSGLGWLMEFADARFNVARISIPRSNHFFCTTGGCFRFEHDPETAAAEANFHEPETVDKLIKAFERYASDATCLFVAGVQVTTSD